MLNINAQEIIHVDDQDLIRDLFPGFENTEPGHWYENQKWPQIQLNYSEPKYSLELFREKDGSFSLVVFQDSDQVAYLKFNAEREMTDEEFQIAAEDPELFDRHELDAEPFRSFAFRSRDIVIDTENDPYKYLTLEATDPNSGRSFFAPVVEVKLCDTIRLIHIVDQLRAEKGFLPMLPNEEEKYDQDGWYDLYVLLDNSDIGIHDNLIAIVDSPDAQDHGDQYDIKLSVPDRMAIRQILDHDLQESCGEDVNKLVQRSYKEALQNT